MLTRDATLKLTSADKKAAKAVVLDDQQGMVRNNGSP